jgi:hypothetical protein
MAFAPTPPRANLPAQLLSISSITATAVQQSGGTSGGSGSISISGAPATGVAGTAISLAGSVSPSATAVQIGLSGSASVAPSSWTNATVSGSGWTGTLTPSAAGTYYIWAEQTATPSIQAISGALVVSAAGGTALSYSLIAGSGNASLTGLTLTTTTSGSAPATDWSSSIVHGSTDVAPNVNLSAIGSITAGKFWFDLSNTSVTPGTFGNALFNGSSVAFYAFGDGFGAPTCAPAAPSTAGTYYGKYAFYNSAGTLLGVFTTNAITVT